MKEIGSSLHGSLLSSQPKLHTGKCQNCGYALELYEMDVKRSTRVMRCERCGLLHFYKKDIIGKWRLFKAAKSELVAR
jgi:predicted nucleic-acid-binding Zn-ribbon protein